jgi:hypothetical protein
MNVARMKAPLDSSIMASFVASDDALNDLEQRLAHLQTHGPSPYASGFKSVHSPEPVYSA